MSDPKWLTDRIYALKLREDEVEQRAEALLVREAAIGERERYLSKWEDWLVASRGRVVRFAKFDADSGPRASSPEKKSQPTATTSAVGSQPMATTSPVQPVMWPGGWSDEEAIEPKNVKVQSTDTVSEIVVPPSINPNMRCFNCGENHPMSACDDFKTFGINLKWLRVADLNLCENCFSNKHLVEACPGGPCKRCNQGKHNSLLCRAELVKTY